MDNFSRQALEQTDIAFDGLVTTPFGSAEMHRTGVVNSGKQQIASGSRALRRKVFHLVFSSDASELVQRRHEWMINRTKEFAHKIQNRLRSRLRIN